MTTIDRHKLRAFIGSVAAAVIVASSSIVFAGSPSDPTYVEGFGKDATGGAGKPTYVVTTSAATGPGSFYQAFQPGDTARDINIVFSVNKFTVPQGLVIGSNVTIDGCANGQNGVIFDAGGVGDDPTRPSQDPSVKRGLVIYDPADNIIIRCINFIGFGWPNIAAMFPSADSSANFIWLALSNGQTISNVLVDRCTFARAPNKAFDVTGGQGTTRNVTFQRNLVHGTAVNTLVKYADGVTYIKEKISLHHNVYVHGGERVIAQIRDRINLIDVVNNVAYTKLGDVPFYPDGSGVDPYGLRIWNTNATAQATGVGRAGGRDSGDPTAGNVVVNVVANAFLGDRDYTEVRTDTGASEAGVYIGADNYWKVPATHPNYNHYQGSYNVLPPGTIPTLPWHTPNAIPAGYEITVLPVTSMKTQLLPYVGAPNRTALDQQRIDEVAAALPDSTSTSTPGTPPMAPSNLKVR